MEKYLIKRNVTDFTDEDLVKLYDRSVINFSKALSINEKLQCGSDYLYKYLACLNLRFAKEEKDMLFYDMKLRRLIP